MAQRMGLCYKPTSALNRTSPMVACAYTASLYKLISSCCYLSSQLYSLPSRRRAFAATALLVTSGNVSHPAAGHIPPSRPHTESTNKQRCVRTRLRL